MRVAVSCHATTGEHSNAKTARLAQNRVTHVARVHLRQRSSRRPPWKRSDLVGCWGPKGGAQGQQERRREHVAAPLVCRASIWKFRYRSTSIGARSGVVKRTLPLHTTPQPDLSSLRVCVAVALPGVLVSFVLLPEPLSSLLYATGPHHTLAHDKRSRGSAHPKCPSESEFSHQCARWRCCSCCWRCCQPHVRKVFVALVISCHLT